jgi:hypothetical protein
LLRPRMEGRKNAVPHVSVEILLSARMTGTSSSGYNFAMET